ncbi:MAG TPA: tetratricopeptide repeat protein [Steroidobacteraceae bacterium]|nr:tetratricopeptide repeat protein [Steroidobacteraceae bacterium]
MPSLFDKLFRSKPAAAPAEPAPAAPPAAPAAPASAAAQPAPPATARQFDEAYAKATQALASQDFERATRLYTQAIALNPTHAEAYYKRGNALRMLGQLDEAVASYDQAIELNPDYAFAYCNRGTVQRSLGLLDEALSSYDAAIALTPDDAVAHSNRALVLQDFSRWDEALACYDRAIEINPENADAQYNRSLTALYLGDFDTGWAGFEWRWEHAGRLNIGTVRHFEQPLWLGDEPLEGKRLLIHSEQGLGDTLQFSRYAALCAAQGATVILEVQRPLLSLLSHLQGPTQLIAKGAALPPLDYHCPIMSLPLAFKTTLDTIPAAPNYLQADSSRVAEWKALLGERKRPRVGLVWSGNANNTIDQRRSIALADWIPHLPPEFDYFCLQKDVRDADRAALDASDLFSFDDDLMDFKSTAALCDSMDVVISVDTSLLHLSGALGKRTWLLLPFTPDWRWLRDRDDTPWYPSVKLYRQTAVGDWNGVFARVAADLRREIK